MVKNGIEITFTQQLNLTKTVAQVCVFEQNIHTQLHQL